MSDDSLLMQPALDQQPVNALPTQLDAFQPDLATVYDMMRRWEQDGPHLSYASLEELLGRGRRRSLTTYWQFIDETVNGEGGYANGLYIYPHRLEETDNEGQRILAIRRDQADYDNFTSDIVNAAWDQIVQSKDLITRQSTDPRVEMFWTNVDGKGTPIDEFNEYVQRQARCYGTAFVFVDRETEPLANEGDDQDMGNLPYAYAVPTESIVDWKFDDDGDLEALTVVEPKGDPLWIPGVRGHIWDRTNHNLRIWTEDVWALFAAQQYEAGDDRGQKTVNVRYVLIDSGVNQVHEIPVVMLHNDDPGPREIFGDSEIIDVCRIAQTIYNLDSEMREMDRKAAMFLAMPVKDAKDWDSKKATTGLNNLFVYDGDAGKPEWISPDMRPHETKEAKRQRLIESAYAMAHLRVLVGNIQTKSGYHADVEFQKTARRIARFASQLEGYEIKLARLFGKYIGLNPLAMAKIEVSYPREYGIRDIEKLMQRAEIMLALNLGDETNAEVLRELYMSLFPRKRHQEIDTLVTSSVSSLSQARQEAQQAALGGAAGGKSGQTGPTPQQRIEQILGRANATDATSGVRQSG